MIQFDRDPVRHSPPDDPGARLNIIRAPFCDRRARLYSDRHPRPWLHIMQRPLSGARHLGFLGFFGKTLNGLKASIQAGILYAHLGFLGDLGIFWRF